MSKIQSDNIFVFPCVRRGPKYDLASKVLSEKNITNILKSITDKPSYIISWKDSTLKCIIKGYYFEIEGEKREGNKYAHLIMEPGNDDPLINGTDETTVFNDIEIDIFNGIEIDSTAAGADLILCENDNVPNASWIKFSPKSLDADLTRIDCGELK